MSWDPSLPSELSPESSSQPPQQDPAEEGIRFVVPAILFVCTLLTTLVAGFLFHIRFVSTTSEEVVQRLQGVLNNPMELLDGLPFSVTVLVILLAHEMGHYLSCRYYGIKATLPYVIPAPPPFNPFGTFGAVIKIKSLFLNRRQLFDVGIAGPLAGFVFIVPAIIIGLQQSKIFVLMGPTEQTLEFGEPLLFRLFAFLFFPGGSEANISLHPIGWAAWFGMLATSLNLLPIGQLDGGHVVYALFGHRGHRIISYAAFGGLVGLSLFTAIQAHFSGSLPIFGYLLFAFLLLCMGFRHPRPHTEFPPMDSGRFVVAIIALIIFFLTFIPVPVRFVEHVGSL